MSKQSSHGRFCWYELMTPDPEGAMDFYSEVIGWTTEPWRGGPMPYHFWKNSRGAVGGVMELPEEVKESGAPPNWMAYVEVENLRASIEMVEKLGASVVKAPTEIPEMGSFAVILDPQGAALALYRSQSDSTTPSYLPELGDFSWNELATSDHKAAWAFYHRLFGWQKSDTMDMGEMGIYQIFSRDDIQLGGMFDKPAEMPGPPFWLYYTKVQDVHKAVEQIKTGGGQILNGPMEVPGGDWIAQCMDPQGAAFAVHSAPRQ